MTPEPITSPHNDRLKEVRRLHRRRDRDATGHFVAEGEDLLAAADAAGWQPVERYCAAGSGLMGREVTAQLLDRASALGSGTRTLGVYEQRWAQPGGALGVYLHGVSDPGNVGTILRSAQAFGADCVVLGPGCADPYGPKAVRASMGAIFAVAVARAGDPAQLPGRTVALCADRGVDLVDMVASEIDGPTTLLVGAEREGLPAEVIDNCDAVARIPILSESLNAAMAATVALYELSKNRMSRQ